MLTSDSTPLPILISCDDDPLIHQTIQLLASAQFEVHCVFSVEEAIALFRKLPVAVLLIDVGLGSVKTGIECIPQFLVLDPDCKIIIFSGQTHFEWARKAMQNGAFDYVPKSSPPNDLLQTLLKANDARTQKQRVRQLDFELRSSVPQSPLIGSSPAMERLRKTISKFYKSPGNVLITGETGTGKELVARCLRPESPDGTFAPFIAVDSSTIQNSVAESLLFGHEKGAFTGAGERTRGLIESADGGVLYFDEISNMPLDIQVKLLRVIQEKEVRRLGSNKTIKVSFRVIAATNVDLDTMVTEGRFKEDLLQRLQVLPIEIPPLRNRGKDIFELFDHLQASSLDGYQAKVLTDEAKEALLNYSWPGNVRELANLITYFNATLDPGSRIVPESFPPKLYARIQKSIATQPDSPIDDEKKKCSFGISDIEKSGFYQMVRNTEAELIRKVMTFTKGNVTQASQILQMDRSHVYTKMKELNISRTEWR